MIQFHLLPVINIPLNLLSHRKMEIQAYKLQIQLGNVGKENVNVVRHKSPVVAESPETVPS
jgi:hypothetical protein